MSIKYVGEIEDVNYLEREYIQKYKEKKQLSAKAKKIEGQADHAFRLCKEKEYWWQRFELFSGDIRSKSLN